jgi:hypothetical protein
MKFFVTFEKRTVFLEVRMLLPFAVKPFAKRAIAVGTDNGGIGRASVLNCGHQTASPRHVRGDRRAKKIGQFLSLRLLINERGFDASLSGFFLLCSESVRPQ